ncbi:MAG: pyridoxal phosphate-dependent aminotransferase [Bryobacteraceae bacterium]|jgi:histidinol-phosphate aminotransferase
MLTVEQSKELVARGFSRRNLGRLATMVAAGSALPFYNEPALAQLSMVKGGVPEDAVKIDANENPMGPCAEALEAIHKAASNGGRYDYQLTFNMTETLAEQEGVKSSYVRAYPGSSAPLHHAVLAFCSPTKPYVMADPGYEQGAGAANFLGAKTIRVPLAKDYAHDVKAMVAASPDAGLIYICNPNNPTGSITKKSDIEWAVANKPKGSVIMIDEAYYHLAGISPCTDLVAADKDVIVLRTFSKIYGMAGIRAGAAIGRPDLLEKMGAFMAGALPTTAMGAANASLKVKTLIPERREKIKIIREDTLAFLDKHGFKTVTSVSNKFMVDTKRPATDVITAMRKEKVYIGRPWPVWPTYVRVTVGTQDDMNKFKSAFLKVMA